MDRSTGERQDGKVAAVQLLRALAAGVVAILHLAFAYADHIGPGLGLPRGDGHLAQSAVALFFVISGYIMVVSSQKLFASAGATRVFWTRRCIRILPPYWLATILLVTVSLYLGREVNGSWLASSMILLPTDTVAFYGRPEFLLWPGWTLFYEMVFYLLFGLGLRWGRAPAIAVASVGIVALVLAGIFLSPEKAFFSSLTRPILLVFLFGMALAAFRQQGNVLSPVIRWAALALSILSFFTVSLAGATAPLDITYTVWAGMPAVLLAVAVLGGPLKIPFANLANLLGDSSYALYLLHVPVGMAAISLLPLRFGAWPFLIGVLILVYAASLLAFHRVERPMTRWLNQRLTGKWRRDRLLQETGV
ncbi:acyltransferase family protein [Aurantiacibacter odishensis]|uniref:acyltransferase family protein n=1 Tax=Aurantiacibacter odishensis TaxID=1155476 RepID=UPI000E759566|nr:acyltransferase [Aurantiacibacter odishensis]